MPTRPAAPPGPATAPPAAARARLACGLAWAGVGLGLLPWALIVPLAVYQMDWMLWPWIWPALLGAAAAGAGTLAWRLDVRRARPVAGVALALGLFALAAALAGFGVMLAGAHAMLQMMGG